MAVLLLMMLLLLLCLGWDLAAFGRWAMGKCRWVCRVAVVEMGVPFCFVCCLGLVIIRCVWWSRSRGKMRFGLIWLAKDDSSGESENDSYMPPEVRERSRLVWTTSDAKRNQKARERCNYYSERTVLILSSAGPVKMLPAAEDGRLFRSWSSDVSRQADGFRWWNVEGL